MSFSNRFPGSQRALEAHLGIEVENNPEEVDNEYEKLLNQAIELADRTLILEPLLEMQDSFKTYDDYIEALVETPQMSQILLNLLSLRESSGVERKTLDDPHWQYDQINPYRVNKLNDLLQVSDVAFRVALSRETFEKSVIEKLEGIRLRLKQTLATKKISKEPVSYEEAKISFLLAKIAIQISKVESEKGEVNELFEELYRYSNELIPDTELETT